MTEAAIASRQLVRLFGAHTRCGFAYWLLSARGVQARPAVREVRQWLLAKFGR